MPNPALVRKVVGRADSAQALEDYLAMFSERHGELPNDEEMDGILRYVRRKTYLPWRVYDTATWYLFIITMICGLVIAPCAAFIDAMDKQQSQEP